MFVFIFTDFFLLLETFISKIRIQKLIYLFTFFDLTTDGLRKEEY